MSEKTSRYALPLIAADQAQKHVTHNEALLLIDLLSGIMQVLDRDLTEPPADASDGDLYILGGAGSGNWIGYDEGDLAASIDGGWRRIIPSTGMIAAIGDEAGLLLYWSSSAWSTEMFGFVASAMHATSATEIGIAAGEQAFTLAETARGWGIGARLRAASVTDPSNFMEGIATAYAGTSLTLDVDLVGGSGTHSDWAVNLTGEPGEDGATDYDDLTNKPRLREVLTAARSYYVATTGSDSNDGLTAGTAFRTVQKAADVVATLDMSIYQVTINLGAGFYNETVTLKQVVGGLPPLINGVGATSSTVSKIYAENNFSNWRLRNMGLAGSVGGIGMQVIGHAAISIGLFDFGGTSRNQHARVESSAVLKAEGNFSISTGATQQAFDAIHSDVAFQGRTITINADINVGTFFAARGAGYLQLWSCTFSTGSFTVTGKRYACTSNGVLETGGVADLIPGTTAGTTATGGQYI
jgi:hypothetical protein